MVEQQFFPERTKELFQSVVEHMLDAALILDWDGTILFANNAVSRLLEMASPRQVIGQNAAQFVQPASLLQVITDLEAVKSGKGGFLSQYLLKTDKGNDLWVEGLGTKITLDGRELNLVILRDVTLRRLLEAELRQAYVEQELRIRERTAALSKANDELRAEIAERHRIEAALRESEEKFRKCAETAPAGIFIYQGSKFRYLNPACETITGYTREELFAMDIWEIAPPDIQADIRSRAEGRQENIVPYERYELPIITKQGGTRWLDASASITEYEGKPAGMAVLIDITDHKRAVEVLRRSKERYQSFLDTLTDMVFITDQKGRLSYVNPALKKCLGGTKEMAGRLFTDIVAPEHRQEAIEHYRQGMAGKDVPVYELDFICEDETRIQVELNVTTYHDEDGKPAGRIGVARNITERREAEKLYQIMARTSSAGVYIIQDGRFRFINRNAAAYAGYEEKELRGVECLNIVHPADRAEVAKNAVKMLHGEITHPYSFRLRTKQGGTRWIMETVTTIQYCGRRAVLANSMDVTERMEMERRLIESEARYRSLFEGANDGIIIMENGVFINCNRKALEIFQCREEELIGQTPAWFSTPLQPNGSDSRQGSKEKILLAEDGVPQMFEWRHRHRDGTSFFTEVALNRLEIPGKELVQVIVRDISDRKTAEEALRASEERYRMIVENIEEGYYETDLQGRLSFLNDACERIVGVPREKLLGSSFRNFASKEDINKIYNHFGMIYKTGQPVRDLIWQFKRADGGEQHLEVSASIIKNLQGQTVGFRGIIRDVTARRQAEEKVHWIAYHDHLTGLPNRLLFQDRFTQLLAHTKRKGERFAVVVMDLDRFKDVNDLFGHATGDKLLCSVSERLSRHLREGDTVARMGGDEFLLLLPGIRNRLDADALRGKITQVFQQPFATADRKFTITASIGLAVCPDDGADYETLIRKADQAMYSAKAEARNALAICPD